jgi:hypothetical protein
VHQLKQLRLKFQEKFALKGTAGLRALPAGRLAVE